MRQLGRRNATNNVRTSANPATRISADETRNRSHSTPLDDGSLLVSSESGPITANIVIPVHPQFPNLTPPQGELFFECTLFLYSVLALFLQHLNLYKALWWLPNYNSSYSIKFHMLNPYLISVIGLILGKLFRID